MFIGENKKRLNSVFITLGGFGQSVNETDEPRTTTIINK
jgi:hypothetical protein